MSKKNSMDYLYSDGNEIILIEELQRKTQREVVLQYKDCRKNQKMTQVELAKITGIPQPNITRFESDKSNPTLEMLVKMAAALGKKVTIQLEDLDEKIR